MGKEIKDIESYDISPLSLIRWVNSEYDELVLTSTKENKILNQRAVRSILKILSIKNGISQNELAREVHLKPSTVSVALLEMEEFGYISRSKSTSDTRKVNVFLTPLGYDLKKEVDYMLLQIEEKMLSSLNESEKLNLKSYLFKILENL